MGDETTNKGSEITLTWAFVRVVFLASQENYAGKSTNLEPHWRVLLRAQVHPRQVQFILFEAGGFRNPRRADMPADGV